jgi:hypothetical protein
MDGAMRQCDTMSDEHDRHAAPAKREVIRCAKCDAENLAGATRCHECGAHLYLVCQQCGRPSIRSLRSCAFCGARLGRSAWLRLRDRVFGRFSFWKALGSAVVLAIVIRILVVACRGLMSPEPEEPSVPEYDKTVEQDQTRDLPTALPATRK